MCGAASRRACSCRCTARATARAVSRPARGQREQPPTGVGNVCQNVTVRHSTLWFAAAAPRRTMACVPRARVSRTPQRRHAWRVGKLMRERCTTCNMCGSLNCAWHTPTGPVRNSRVRMLTADGWPCSPHCCRCAWTSNSPVAPAATQSQHQMDRALLHPTRGHGEEVTA